MAESFFIRQKYRPRFPEVWKRLGELWYGTMWGEDVWDCYRRPDGVWVVRRGCVVIGRFWRPFDAKMLVREDMWNRHRHATTGWHFTSWVRGPDGAVPGPPPPPGAAGRPPAAPPAGGVPSPAPGAFPGLGGAAPAGAGGPPEPLPVAPRRKWKNRLASLVGPGYTPPAEVSEEDKSGLDAWSAARNTGSSGDEPRPIGLSPQALKELYVMAATATPKAPKADAAKKTANAPKQLPGGMTADEVEAAVAGKLKTRPVTGDKKQSALTATAENGRFKGRPMGVTTGLPIFAACCYFLQQNSKVPKAERKTDEQLAQTLLDEFPGRGTSWFNSTAGWRRSYNTGKFTKGRIPTIVSVPYDAEGVETAPKRGGRGAGAAAPAKAEKAKAVSKAAKPKAAKESAVDPDA